MLVQQMVPCLGRCTSYNSTLTRDGAQSHLNKWLHHVNKLNKQCIRYECLQMNKNIDQQINSFSIQQQQ